MLKVQGIYKHFPLQDQALYEDFNLELEEGSFLIILGSNGSGKSSLLNLITAEMEADRGFVLFQGEDLQSIAPHERMHLMARVYQDPKRMTASDLTVFENLSLAYQKTKLKRLSFLLKKDLRSFFKHSLAEFSMGLEDKLDVKTAYLSGGERQALALLMASFHQPRLLLLDEHTAALDPKSHERLMQMTDALVSKNKISTIMVTHSLEDALIYGDRLIIMHEGKIVKDYDQKAKQALSLEDLRKDFVHKAKGLR